MRFESFLLFFELFAPRRHLDNHVDNIAVGSPPTHPVVAQTKLIYLFPHSFSDWKIYHKINGDTGQSIPSYASTFSAIGAYFFFAVRLSDVHRSKLIEGWICLRMNSLQE